MTRSGRHMYFCGNGGSTANAMHMANDAHQLPVKGRRHDLL
jgi:phosphoheptose isomerase